MMRKLTGTCAVVFIVLTFRPASPIDNVDAHMRHSHIRKPITHRHADTMDVYVTSKNVVRIVDFNTWGGTTQPLLFTWEELIATARALDEENPKGEELSYELSDEDMMRVVREPGQVRPGVRASCGVPFDLVDKTEGGAIDEFLRKHRDDFM